MAEAKSEPKMEEDEGPEKQDCCSVYKLSGTDPQKEASVRIFFKSKEDSNAQTPYQQGLLWIRDEMRQLSKESAELNRDDPDSEKQEMRFTELEDFEKYKDWPHKRGYWPYSVDYGPPHAELIGVEWYTSYDYHYFIKCHSLKEGKPLKLIVYEH